MADHIVNAGGDLQGAIDAAVGGDRILIEGNALFVGNFRLKAKGNSLDIIIRPNLPDSALPADGYRVSPSYAGVLPRIRASTGGLPAIAADPASQHYIILGLEFEPNPNGYGEIVRFGNNSDGGTSPYVAYDDFQLRASQPADLVLDRCLVRGDAFKGQKRGVFLNGIRLTVKNCYIDRIFGIGQDAQAIAIMNAWGPLTITNNYLEGAGENFITGGADPVAFTTAKIAASPAPTVATATLENFKVGNGGVVHNINSQGELIGQRIAMLYSGGTLVHHAIVTARVGNAIEWLPAAPSVPDSGASSDVRWGANPVGVTFRRNYVYKPTSWKNAMLATPGGVSATPNTSSGSLAAGTYGYRVQAVNDAGYNQQTYISDAAAQVQATLASTGRIDISWTAVPNAQKYRVWGRTLGSPDRYFETTSTSLSDTGGSGTTGSFNATGSRPQVKNLFELKSGVTVQIDSNLMENSWKGADVGYAVWLKVVNQSGQGRFVETKDVMFEKNWLKNLEGPILFSGQEYYGGNTTKPPRMGATTVKNNVWENSTKVRTMNIGTGPNPLTIDHNTFLHGSPESDLATLLIYGDLGFVFTFTNNLLRRFDYGVRAVDPVLGTLGEGTPSLAALVTYGGAYTFLKNAIADAPSGSYPANNFFPTEAQWQAAFTTYNGGSGGNYRIAPAHAYNDAGTDLKDLGADIDLVEAAISGVIQGVPEAGAVDGTIFKFTASNALPPATLYATLRMRGTHRVLEFANAVTEAAYFGGFMPQHYVVGNSIIFTLTALADDVTAANRARFELALERVGGSTNLGVDNFGLTKTIDWAPPTTAGQAATASVTYTGAELATLGIVAGDIVRIRLRRVGADAADTVTTSVFVRGLDARKA
jgi:hypothetical protein